MAAGQAAIDLIPTLPGAPPAVTYADVTRSVTGVTDPPLFTDIDAFAVMPIHSANSDAAIQQSFTSLATTPGNVTRRFFGMAQGGAATAMVAHSWYDESCAPVGLPPLCLINEYATRVTTLASAAMTMFQLGLIATTVIPPIGTDEYRAWLAPIVIAVNAAVVLQSFGRRRLAYRAVHRLRLLRALRNLRHGGHCQLSAYFRQYIATAWERMRAEQLRQTYAAIVIQRAVRTTEATRRATAAPTIDNIANAFNTFGSFNSTVISAYAALTSATMVTAATFPPKCRLKLLNRLSQNAAAIMIQRAARRMLVKGQVPAAIEIQRFYRGARLKLHIELFFTSTLIAHMYRVYRRKMLVRNLAALLIARVWRAHCRKARPSPPAHKRLRRTSLSPTIGHVNAQSRHSVAPSPPTWWPFWLVAAHRIRRVQMVSLSKLFYWAVLAQTVRRTRSVVLDYDDSSGTCNTTEHLRVYQSPHLRVFGLPVTSAWVSAAVAGLLIVIMVLTIVLTATCGILAHVTGVTTWALTCIRRPLGRNCLRFHRRMSNDRRVTALTLRLFDLVKNRASATTSPNHTHHHRRVLASATVTRRRRSPTGTARCLPSPVTSRPCISGPTVAAVALSLLILPTCVAFHRAHAITIVTGTVCVPRALPQRRR
jgi:hypothetical protein